ncbi:hypothetical protein GUJ93_ZPchr0006g46258 [Zizania palustris]|uniref:Heat shock factor binding protein n=1 Tax=Zizania palustris TaxID=103762 RepID=A0A8J5TG39_ZIZPA|nr:hypothetical protein GUJ93_ZPchr0006g46258 [Zizania palustris]
MAAPGSGGIPIKAEQDSDGSAQSTADMTAFVQNLLMQMQTRFQAMSENIISKNILLSQFPCALYFYEMGARIDELEQSINDLKTEMGTEGMTPTKPKDEESKAADSSAA